MNEKKKIDYTLQIGNDNGNSEHDLVIDGNIIEQPNVMSKVRKLPMLDEVNPDYVAKNIHDNLIVSINSPIADPGYYYIGRYALNSGERIRNIEVGADNSKLNSDVIPVNTLAQVAGYSVKKAFLEGNKLDDIEIHIKADMTTALPVTQYTKADAEKFSEKFMNERHNVTVHCGNIKVDVFIEFTFTKTLPEAVPATFAIQNMTLINKDDAKLTDAEKLYNKEVKEMFAELNKKNEVQGKDKTAFIDGNFFRKKRILHASIGEGTSEYPKTDDIVFDPNFIRGSNNGIGHAIDNSLDEFKKETNLLNYSRQKYSEVIRDLGHKYHDIAMDIVSGYIEDESEEILHHIKYELQRANNEVDIICVYGGGSILMRRYLEKKLEEICKVANITLFYVPEKYAVTLEAKGMYQFTKNNIFKKLKENYIKNKH